MGILLLKGLKAAVGILSVTVMARYFGIRLERDHWIVAFTIMTALVQFIFGPINETFRSRLMLLKSSGETGESEFRSGIYSLLKWTALLSLMVALLCVPLIELLLKAFGYDASSPGYGDLQRLVWMSLPIFVLLQMTTLATGVLNLFGAFYLPEAISIGGVLLNTITIALFADSLGVYSLWLGTLLSLLLLFFVLGTLLARQGIRLSMILRADSQGFRLCLAFSLAMFIPLFVGQLGVLTERIFATRIGVGNVSAIDYARKFLDVPLNLVTTSMATVLGPLLASLHGGKRLEAFFAETARVTRMMILATAPLLIVLFMAPEALIELLLKRGNFDDTAVSLTARILQIFVPGILGAIVFSAMGQVLISSARVRPLSIANALLHLGVVAGNITLVGTFGVYTFPLTWSVMHLVIGGALLLLMAVNERQAALRILAPVFLLILFWLGASLTRSIWEPRTLGFLMAAIAIGFGGWVALLGSLGYLGVPGFREEYRAICDRVRSKP